MTNIMLEMNEQLCRAVGFVSDPSACKCNVCKDLNWIAPDAKTLTGGYKAHIALPNLTDPTNWFKWVAPKLLSENSSSFDLYVFLGGAIVKVREHGKTVAVTDEELPGHALFLAARELLCKEERE